MSAWLIYFEDAQRPAELFSGEGAEEAAAARYQALLPNWNCHLFRREDNPFGIDLSQVWVPIQKRPADGAYCWIHVQDEGGWGVVIATFHAISDSFSDNGGWEEGRSWDAFHVSHWQPVRRPGPPGSPSRCRHGKPIEPGDLGGPNRIYRCIQCWNETMAKD